MRRLPANNVRVFTHGSAGPYPHARGLCRRPIPTRSSGPWIALAAFLLLRPVGVSAQSRSSSTDNELLLAGGQTVVTASKRRQRASDVPAAVQVITAQQIRQSGAATLLDVLRYAAGVDVFEANRSVGNVSIRAGNRQFSDKLLVMVDGRSIYEDFFGGVLWGTGPLLLSRIKRIEIVRGPGSALYGANAFNGVINIITYTPAELATARDRVNLRLMEGEQDSQFDEIVASAGSARNFSAAIGAAYNHTSGYGDSKPGAIRDSYTAPVVTLDAQKRLKSGSLIFSTGNSEATSDLYETLYLTGAHAHNSFASLLYSGASAAHPLTARVTGNFLDQGAGGINYGNTQNLDAEAQQVLTPSRHNTLQIGGMYRFVVSSSSITGPQPHHETLFGIYGEDEQALDRRTDLFLGLRADHHSLYGYHITPRLALIRHLDSSQSVRLSFGTAFRDPTVVESYEQIPFPIGNGASVVLLGSPKLTPEQVTSYEAGYRKELLRGYAALNIYYNQETHLIGEAPASFQPSPPFPPMTPATLQSANTGSGTVAGFELETELELSRTVRGLFNYSYADARLPSTPLLPTLAPKHKANLAIDTALSRSWNVWLGAHFVGAQTLELVGPHPNLDAYTTLDARLAYRVKGGRWTLALVCANLLDDRHLEYPEVAPTGLPPQSTPIRRTVYLQVLGRL